MTLAQIKKQLNVVALDLSRQMDEDNKATCWLRHWDNLQRIAVVVHEDVLAIAKKEPNNPNFALKSTIRMSQDSVDKKTGEAIAGSEYVNHILIVSDKIEDTI